MTIVNEAFQELPEGWELKVRIDGKGKGTPYYYKRQTDEKSLVHPDLSEIGKRIEHARMQRDMDFS